MEHGKSANKITNTPDLACTKECTLTEAVGFETFAFFYLFFLLKLLNSTYQSTKQLFNVLKQYIYIYLHACSIYLTSISFHILFCCGLHVASRFAGQPDFVRNKALFICTLCIFLYLRKINQS